MTPEEVQRQAEQPMTRPTPKVECPQDSAHEAVAGGLKTAAQAMLALSRGLLKGCEFKVEYVTPPVAKPDVCQAMGTVVSPARVGDLAHVPRTEYPSGTHIGKGRDAAPMFAGQPFHKIREDSEADASIEHHAEAVVNGVRCRDVRLYRHEGKVMQLTFDEGGRTTCIPGRDIGRVRLSTKTAPGIARVAMQHVDVELRSARAWATSGLPHSARVQLEVAQAIQGKVPSPLTLSDVYGSQQVMDAKDEDPATDSAVNAALAAVGATANVGMDMPKPNPFSYLESFINEHRQRAENNAEPKAANTPRRCSAKFEPLGTPPQFATPPNDGPKLPGMTLHDDGMPDPEVDLAG